MLMRRAWCMDGEESQRPQIETLDVPLAQVTASPLSALHNNSAGHCGCSFQLLLSLGGCYCSCQKAFNIANVSAGGGPPQLLDKAAQAPRRHKFTMATAAIDAIPFSRLATVSPLSSWCSNSHSSNSRRMQPWFFNKFIQSMSVHIL